MHNIWDDINNYFTLLKSKQFGIKDENLQCQMDYLQTNHPSDLAGCGRTQTSVSCLGQS